jgi:hypothetical protein
VLDAQHRLEQSRNPISGAAEPIAGRSGAQKLAGMSVIRTTIAGFRSPTARSLARRPSSCRTSPRSSCSTTRGGVFLWGSQGEKLGLDYDPELLYVGAMFHDSASSKATVPSTSASRSTGQRRR